MPVAPVNVVTKWHFPVYILPLECQLPQGCLGPGQAAICHAKVVQVMPPWQVHGLGQGEGSLSRVYTLATRRRVKKKTWPLTGCAKFGFPRPQGVRCQAGEFPVSQVCPVDAAQTFTGWAVCEESPNMAAVGSKGIVQGPLLRRSLLHSPAWPGRSWHAAGSDRRRRPSQWAAPCTPASSWRPHGAAL